MKKLLFLVLFLLPVGYAMPQTVTTDSTREFPYVTKYAYTGEERLIQWCQPDEASYPGIMWDIQIEHFESGTIVLEETELTVKQYLWTPSVSGHYVVRIRSRLNGNVSDWNSSTTDKMAEGTCLPQEGWWFFAWIKPVDEIIPL